MPLSLIPELESNPVCQQCGPHCVRADSLKLKDKIGVLVVQLGTPDAPTSAAVKKYLRQFLSDARVIEGNRILWFAILHGIILPFRSRRSAKLYQRIWTSEGSPLAVITRAQSDSLRAALKNDGIEVELGMRYGNPSIASALDKLTSDGCSRVVVFPLYPQYSASTTASTYEEVFRYFKDKRVLPALQFVPPYYAHDDFIRVQADHLNAQIAALPFDPEAVVFSYHGIPRAYVERGDPYCCQCYETTRLLAPRLNLRGARLIHTFQSRFGRQEWLQPYTDVVIRELAVNGTTRIAVACPGFAADCLETIDELGHEGRQDFLKHGGKEFALMPCLNKETTWIDAMRSIVGAHFGLRPEALNQGWAG